MDMDTDVSIAINYGLDTDVKYLRMLLKADPDVRCINYTACFVTPRVYDNKTNYLLLFFLIIEH